MRDFPFRDSKKSDPVTARKILLVQPQLSSLDGHEHTQISALDMMLPDDRIIVLTRIDFALADQMTGVEIYPVFPLLAKSGAGDRQNKKPHDSNKESSSSKPSVPERYLSYVEALSAAVRRFEAGPTDLLIVPSAGPGCLCIRKPLSFASVWKNTMDWRLQVSSTCHVPSLLMRWITRSRHTCLMMMRSRLAYWAANGQKREATALPAS